MPENENNSIEINDNEDTLECTHGLHRFIHARYWLTWTGLGLLYLTVVWLPYRWQMKIGRLLGRLVRAVSRKRRRIVNTNLKLCFPELSQDQCEKLDKEHFESLGISLIEFGIAFWMSNKKLQRLSHVKGIENLTQAHQKGNGVILLAGHFTTLEVAIRLLTTHSPISIHGIYREQKNPLFNAMLLRHRHENDAKPISRKKTHSLIGSLKEGSPVFYLPDQDFGTKYRSEFIPFFGVPAATITATTRLAKLSNADVVPVSFYRLDDNKGYHLEFHPALDNFPSDSDTADLTRINHCLEELIKEKPEQYFWFHRRFKTRPEGEETVY